MNNISGVKREHIEECANLYVQVFNAEPWNDDWSFQTACKRLTDIYNAPGFEGVLFMGDGNVKGAVFGNYEQFYNGIHYNLKEMFISNELQGIGIGSKLLGKLEVILKSKDVTSVYLFTSKGTGTYHFYQKNGFDLWDSMAMMGKDL